MKRNFSKIYKFNNTVENLIARNFKLISFGFSVLILIYLLLRAIFVPFLHDEIMTFWFYINTDEFIPFRYNVDINAANNHLLNTFLSSILYKLLGNSPFVLRLANLMFIPLYCYFSYKISDQLSKKSIALILFFSLIFVYPIIEFLALSRGYGMSFALLMGAIWFVIQFLKNRESRFLLFSILFTVLALTANLSLMLCFIAILFFLTLKVLLNNEKKYINILILLLFGYIPLIFFGMYSFLLKQSGALYYGGQDGLLTFTITALLKALFGAHSEIYYLILFSFILISITITAILVRKNFSPKILERNYMFLSVLLWGNIIGIVLLNKLFHVNYPDVRAAFHLYFLFVLNFVFVVDEIQKNYFKIIFIKHFIIALLIVPLYFVLNINLEYVSVYKEDRVPKRFYKKLNQKANDLNESMIVGSYFGRTLVMAFYNYLHSGNLSKNYDSHYPSLIPDFQIIKNDDLNFFLQNFFIIDYDKVTGYYLLERKNKLQRKQIASVTNINIPNIFNKEFYNFIQIPLDTLIISPLVVEFEMNFYSKAEPFEAWFVATTFDKNNNSTAYEYVPLNWLRSSWDNKKIKTALLLTNLPPLSDRLLVYIWNIKKKEFGISDGKVTIKKVDIN